MVSQRDAPAWPIQIEALGVEEVVGGDTPSPLSHALRRLRACHPTDPGDLFLPRNAGNIIPTYGGHSGGEVATIKFVLSESNKKQ